jgi:hypothetical protein
MLSIPLLYPKDGVSETEPLSVFRLGGQMEILLCWSRKRRLACISRINPHDRQFSEHEVDYSGPISERIIGFNFRFSHLPAIALF